MNSADLDSFPQYSKKQLLSLNCFFLGVLIYHSSISLISTLRFDIKLGQGFQIIGLVLMLIGFINLINYKFSNLYLKTIYTVYCLWLASLIIKGFGFLLDYTYLKDFLFNPYQGLLYFAPLILLFPLNFQLLKKVFQAIVLFGIVYACLSFSFLGALLNPDRESTYSQNVVETFHDLSFSSGFILLTILYHPFKKKLIAILVILLALFFVTIRARRGLMFMYINIGLFSYLLYIYKSRLLFVSLYISLLLSLILALFVSNYYKPKESRLLGYVLERGDENTRERVEYMFNDDMKINDWIIGRGIRGEYFCPDVEEEQKTNYRHTIETGFKQMILKGGIISLGLFLLIALPAIFKGIFRSRNNLSKASAIWILMCIINSYPGTTNAFTLQYLIVWICIGICYSKSMRQLSDKQIRHFLEETNKKDKKNNIQHA